MKHYKHALAIALLLFLFLSGCGSSKPQGIYYPALSHNFLMQSLASSPDVSACRSISASRLYYNGEVYTYSQGYREYSKSDLPLDTLSGTELCTVYGNDGFYWSDVKEALAACTHTGTLCRAIGYEDTFRVCLYFEEPARVDLGHGQVYHLYIFDRTNNITLHTGKDYYTELFCFPTDASLNNLDMQDAEIASFMEALLAAEFIDPSEESLPEFDFNRDTTYFFSYTDSLGLTNSVAIYEDGYVVDKKDHLFILKLEPSVCRAVIDKIHQPEWPGEYKYVTYSYDKDRDIRTEYNYELKVSETDTHFNFDLCVTQTDVHLNTNSIPIDNPVIIGPQEHLSIPKAETNEKHVLSFVSQKFPDTAPELITYIELKKGLQEDIISLRYAASEEELKLQEFIVLNKQ